MTEERRVEIVTPDPATAWSVLLPAGAPSHVGILLTEPAGRTVRLILHREVALAVATALIEHTRQYDGLSHHGLNISFDVAEGRR